ncbi:hypothetical protein KDM41_04625 [bacterium]|nr:hypothetical protein [bacterium]
MAIERQFDAAKRILRISVIGKVTIPEFQDFMKDMTGSPDYDPDVDALWDLRRFDFEHVDAEFWQQIVRARRRFPERSRARLAHLVDGDFAFGMMRMYQILVEIDGADLIQEVGVFRTEADAEAWLTRPRG